VRPFRRDAALFVAVQTDATRSNSLPHRQLRARTVTSSEAAIASVSPFGVDVADVGGGRRAARAEQKDALPSIVPVLAAVLPQLDRSRCAPGTRRETIFSGFARLGGP
jgi:hypothetical protein